MSAFSRCRFIYFATDSFHSDRANIIHFNFVSSNFHINTLMSSGFIALYGRFNHRMKPAKVQDVSATLLPFVKNNVIVLPKEHNLDTLFPNTISGTKFLQITLANGKKINILSEAYHFDIRIDLLSNENTHCIVYNIFINPGSNWRAIISGQLADIRKYGLLDESDLYIHVTDTHRIKAVLPFVRKKAGADAVITHSSSNQFEYPGIRLLYEQAKKHPHKTYLYFHTKGMSQNIKKRKRQERAIMTGTFGNWRKSMEGFQDPAINKIGLFPAKESPEWGGWVWFNYFMARGTYLHQCDDPVVTTDRYYYESWLGKKDGVVVLDDGYSTFTHKKESFSQQQAADYLIKHTDDYIEKRKLESRFYRLFGRLKTGGE